MEETSERSSKNHKVPDTIDLEAPRLASYKQKWKRHQDTVYWVDIQLAQWKGLKSYQTRSIAIILHETLPAYCIPKVVRMETGEVIYEKVYMSPRPPPKISLRHDWKRELGSEHAQRPEGQVVQQSWSFQSNQPIPRGDPLSGMTWEPCKMEEKRPVPRRSMLILFTKRLSLQIDRRNPLSKRVKPKHVHLMTVRVSTLNWHMTDRGNPLSKQTQ